MACGIASGMPPATVPGIQSAHACSNCRRASDGPKCRPAQRRGSRHRGAASGAGAAGTPAGTSAAGRAAPGSAAAGRCVRESAAGGSTASRHTASPSDSAAKRRGTAPRAAIPSSHRGRAAAASGRPAMDMAIARKASPAPSPAW
ncbi:hypothetical protein CCZ27_07915 [Thauera sinica]|nr:hypothetical protein CCZ27_07915 [Thauera sp. K11]